MFPSGRTSLILLRKRRTIMKKTRILGIAPYEGIKLLMEQIASHRSDIELTAFVGDLEAGAAIASHYAPQDLDVIISRGGTAEMIRQKTSFPVVDIPLSVYDIFRSIKLAENYTSNYALVGFPNITRNAHFLCDMLQYDITIHTIHTEQEAVEILEKLARENCRTILCDQITNSLARQFGLASILITSGTESIENAFDDAVLMARSQEKCKSSLAFYRAVLDHDPYTSVVFRPDGEAVFFSRVSDISSYLMEQLRQNLSSVLEAGEKKIYCEHRGLLYVLHGYRMTMDGSPCVCYYINQRKVPLALTRNGIHYVTKEEASESYFGSFYGITHSAASLQDTIRLYSSSCQPVVILGETGTGKHQIARLLYIRSPLGNKPMAVIDCARINEKSWSFLTDHNNSPLSDTNTTIFIHSMEALTDSRFAELLSIISDLNLTVKNRMLFTFSYEPDGSIPLRCQKLMNTFSCLTLRLEPLRKQAGSIPDLSSLYISALNMRLSTEVIGLEPDAVKLLQSFSWPFNYDQLKRVLNELVTTARTPYITASAVSKLLGQECSVPQTGRSPIDLTRTLEEINLEILRLVLAEEHQNQSAAAKRLGISRTTLWRMLQKLGHGSPSSDSGRKAPEPSEK